MILSEGYVKVPGKHYKAKVQCVSTRRLTTMEWLIVNCTEKFYQSRTTSNQTVKYVFEEIFQLTSSEILIKPCIESLMSEQVILLDVGSNFDYSSLRFSQIRLTEKGRRMAQDGLFPGEPKELPLDIYYNPLTEKMNQFSYGNENPKDAIEFGTESDYSMDFPEEKIIDALHRGLVGRGRFVASKLRIENIDCDTSMDWENCIKLEIWADAEGNIFTKPEIKEDNVKSLITSLFFTKEVTSAKMPLLMWLKETEPKKIIGSGSKMKEGFLNISRNGNYVGMPESIYSLYKRTTTAFKQKVIFLWGTKNFNIRKENESIFIDVPCEFSINGCVAVNDKNESISFSKNSYSYDGRQIIVPIAFEDKRIKIGKRTLFDWIENVVKEKQESEIYYLALYSLPELSKKRKLVSEILSTRWKNVALDDVIKDIRSIAQTCEILEQEMLRFDDLGSLLWGKMSSLENNIVLERLSEIMRLNCITSGSDAQKYIMEKLLERTELPKSYDELLPLLLSMGIRNHKDALMYDEQVKHLYTRELILDTIKVIMDRKFTSLPELFEFDLFFNGYAQAINELEFLISGLKIFEEADSEAINNAIEKCPDVAMIQSYAAEITAKNSELLNLGINVYTEMKAFDAERTEHFFENLETIINKVGAMMKEEVHHITSERRTSSTAQKEEKKNKMYIVDTCALMHRPDLLLFFTDDEYVRIPTKVIDELGKIKDMRSSKYDSDLSRVASKVASDIERKYLKLFNDKNKLRLMIENADLDLLPEDLDKTVPDNQILSVALKYTDWDTTIISDDGVFRLTTLAQNLNAVTSKAFIEEHEIYKRSLERWVEKYEKAGGSFSKSAAALTLSASTNPVEKIKKGFEEDAAGDAMLILEQKHFEDSAIDVLPIRELKKYFPADLTEPVCTLLQNNGIKTIGQFRLLTTQRAQGLKAKGKQTILKNNIVRALAKFKELQNLSDSLVNGEPVNADIVPDNIDDMDTKQLTNTTDTENKSNLVSNRSEDLQTDESRVSRFLELIQLEQKDQALELYQSLAESMNMREQAVLFRSMFNEVIKENYTVLIEFICSIYPAWQVRQIVKYLDEKVINLVKENTDFKKIAVTLVNSERFDVLGVFVTEWNIILDFDNWFDGKSKEEILQSINTEDSIAMYISEYIQDDEEKLMAYFEKNFEIPVKIFVKCCIDKIAEKSVYTSKYIQLLCDYYQYQREKVNAAVSIPVTEVVSLAIALPDFEEDSLKTIVDKCTTMKYSFKINKRYAQAEPTERTLDPLRRLINAKLSVERIVYTYMNTRLRADVNVDRFLTEMNEGGYPYSQVVELLKDYWIVGKIKYVQDDGFVRVASGSLSNSRLMVFNSTRIHINGEAGWQNPEEGMLIYFKIQDFKEGGLFYIHYPCTDIAYSN